MKGGRRGDGAGGEGRVETVEGSSCMAGVRSYMGQFPKTSESK